MVKKNAEDTKQAANEQKLDAVLAEKEYVSKADIARARGKEPDGPPSVGRTGPGGVTKSAEKMGIKIPEKRVSTIHVAVRQAINKQRGIIPHAWSPKAREQMLRDHMGLNNDDDGVKKKIVQAEKDPFEDMVTSIYADKLGYFGFPANAFKAAMVEAVRRVAKVSAPDLREAVMVVGDLVPIWGMPHCRMDPVVVGPWNARVADIRFRGEINPWMAVLTIEHYVDIIAVDEVMHLIDRAGDVGVGEWRPAKSGNHGCFELVKGGPDAVAALQKELGRYRKQDLTIENSGVLACLDEIGLAEVWLDRRKRREAARAEARPS